MRASAGRGYGRAWPVRNLAEAATERVRGIVAHPVPAVDPPLVVISPHLDDAVLSCGQLLAGSPGSLVVTVFTGPGSRYALTPWDRACGFRAGDDIMAIRQQEDDRALALLGARPVRLGLIESAYGGLSSPTDVAAAIEAVLVEAGATTPVVAPLGVQHPDHRTVAAAVAELASSAPTRPWWWYGDLPYAEIEPDEVAERLAAAGTPEAGQPGPVGSRARKQAAVRRYRSQLRSLHPNIPATLTDERYWQIGSRVAARRGEERHTS